MLNKVILQGRLTKDPVMYFSISGTAIVKTTLAVRRKYAKQNEEHQTDFINIVSYDKTAEFVGKWFKKGMLMVCVGSLRQTKWVDDDGTAHYGMDVVAEDVYFGEGKKENTSETETGQLNDYDITDENNLPF